MRAIAVTFVLLLGMLPAAAQDSEVARLRALRDELARDNAIADARMRAGTAYIPAPSRPIDVPPQLPPATFSPSFMCIGARNIAICN